MAQWNSKSNDRTHPRHVQYRLHPCSFRHWPRQRLVRKTHGNVCWRLCRYHWNLWYVKQLFSLFVLVLCENVFAAAAAAAAAPQLKTPEVLLRSYLRAVSLSFEVLLDLD